jgi:hypothetical protein
VRTTRGTDDFALVNTLALAGAAALGATVGVCFPSVVLQALGTAALQVAVSEQPLAEGVAFARIGPPSTRQDGESGSLGRPKICSAADDTRKRTEVRRSTGTT